MTASLSNLLSRANVLTPAQVRDAEVHQAAHGATFGHAVVALGFLEEQALVAFLQNKLKIPAVRGPLLSGVSRAVTGLIPAAVAQAHRLLPVSHDAAGNLTIAMADPTDDAAARAVSAAWNGYVIRAAAPLEALDAAVTRRFGPIHDETAHATVPPAAPPSASASLSASASSSLTASASASLSASASASLRASARESTAHGDAPSNSTTARIDPSDNDPAASTLGTARGARRAAATRWSPSLQRPQRSALPLSRDAVNACISTFATVDDRDALVAHLLDFIDAGFDQTILFVHSRDELRGIDARGDKIDRDAVKRVRLSSTHPSIFRTAIDRMVPLFGPMPRAEPVDRAFSDALGGVHGNVLVLPIVVEHRIPLVCFAHGTRHSVRNNALVALSDAVSERLHGLLQASKKP